MNSIQEMKKIWNRYRDIPRYQHVLYLMNNKGLVSLSHEDFQYMDEWDLNSDCLIDEIENDWKCNNKDTYNWNSEFPEMYQESLKMWITDLENYLKKFYHSQEEYRNKGLSIQSRDLLAFMWDGVDIDEKGRIDVSRLEKKIKKLKFSLYVSENRDSINKNEITDDMIVKAREYPFENLIQVDKRNFAKCPFHNEKTPSFYIKNNFGYCFSCGKSSDSIDMYRKIYNKNFIEAVKFLSQST